MCVRAEDLPESWRRRGEIMKGQEKQAETIGWQRRIDLMEAGHRDAALPAGTKQRGRPIT